MYQFGVDFQQLPFHPKQQKTENKKRGSNANWEQIQQPHVTHLLKIDIKILMYILNSLQKKERFTGNLKQFPINK